MNVSAQQHNTREARTQFTPEEAKRLLKLRTRLPELREHVQALEALLLIAQKEEGTCLRMGGQALAEQIQEAEALWREKQRESADAEAVLRSLKLAAQGYTEVDRLYDALFEADREIAAGVQDVYMMLDFDMYWKPSSQSALAIHNS